MDDNQISVNVKRAAIASEDANFVNHAGFDVQGIENAIKRKMKSGAISAGGSTISQQLAKIYFIPQSLVFSQRRKALITLMIENMWTKERILLAYLNVAEFGKGVYGIEAAAQHYYHKSAAHFDQATKPHLWLPCYLIPNILKTTVTTAACV